MIILCLYQVGLDSLELNRLKCYFKFILSFGFYNFKERSMFVNIIRKEDRGFMVKNKQ